MKTSLWRIAGAPMLVLAMALLAGPGCETDDNVNSGQIGDYFDENPYVSAERPEGSRYIRILPASASVTYVGEVVRFQADGGTEPYEWEVSNGARGSIAPSRPNEALYTVRQVAANSVMVFDRAGRSGVAEIKSGLVPGPDPEPPPPPAPLAATANPSTLTADGARSVVTATGGDPPYQWTLQDAALGSLDTNTGESVVYTRNRRGDNSVRVTDSEGATVAVVIQQP